MDIDMGAATFFQTLFLGLITFCILIKTLIDFDERFSDGK